MGVETITRDGVGQVRRETGFARITAVEPKGDRNAKVTFAAEHLREPVVGWADRLDRSVYDAVEACYHDQRRVTYVVETRPKTPTDKPLADLANREKVRELVEVRPVGADGSTTPASSSTAASSTPAPRPAAQEAAAAAPAERTDSGRETYPCPVEECQVFAFASRGELARHLDEDHPTRHEPRPATADELDPFPAAGAPSDPAAAVEEQPPPPDDPQGPPPPAARGRRNARIEEARPWEAYNSDGSLNLGSYAVTASLGYTELAYELALGKARTDLALNGGTLAPPSWPMVRSLARALLTAADRAQKTTRSDGNVDRMDNSHTRARGAVRSALDAYPVPWGATADEREAWVATLADVAANLLGIAVELVDHQDGRL